MFAIKPPIYEVPAGYVGGPVVSFAGKIDPIVAAILKGVAFLMECATSSMDQYYSFTQEETNILVLWQAYDVTEEVLAKFKKLKLVIVVGDFVNIDVNVAGRLGIAVSKIPGRNFEEMAVASLSLILSLYNHSLYLQHPFHRSCPRALLAVSEQWREEKNKLDGETVTLGVIGLDRAGLSLALRAKGVGFRVIVCDTFSDPPIEGIEEVYGLERVDNHYDLLKESDCVTLHCKLTASTCHLINDFSIGFLKRGAFLVNTSHEYLVKEEVVLSAVKNGSLGLAAFDPYYSESMYQDSSNYESKVICSVFDILLPRCEYPDFRQDLVAEICGAVSGTSPILLPYCQNKEYFARAGERRAAADNDESPMELKKARMQ